MKYTGNNKNAQLTGKTNLYSKSSYNEYLQSLRFNLLISTRRYNVCTGQYEDIYWFRR